MAKTITFSLDSASIGRAVEELENFAEYVKEALKLLVKELTEQGVHIATVQVSAVGAVDTGELADSIIGYYDEQSGVGVIQSTAYYAYFVEYGTGIVGAGTQHPEMGGMWQPQPSRWTKYDTNGHGERGWYYISDRDHKVHWTRGMPSRPFMYETYKELERLSHRLAAEIFDRG